MTVGIDDDAVINNVIFTDQSSNPATPAAGKTRVFTKSNGLYIIDDDGDVIGPFITGSASSGGGDNTYTSTYANKPAASNDGDLFLPSNGFVIERVTGTAWQPWGPIFPLTPPVSDDFAWVNQGNATVSTTNGGIYISCTAEDNANYHIRKKTISVPYTVTALVMPLLVGLHYPSCGIGWRQSSDGKLVLFRCQNVGLQSNNGNEINILKANNETSDVANYIQLYDNSFTPYIFLRIADDNTNRIVSMSYDGQNFMVIHTVSRTDFMTADEVLFFVSPRNAGYAAGMTLLSWKES